MRPSPMSWFHGALLVSIPVSAFGVSDPIQKVFRTLPQEFAEVEVAAVTKPARTFESQETMDSLANFCDPAPPDPACTDLTPNFALDDVAIMTFAPPVVIGGNPFSWACLRREPFFILGDGATPTIPSNCPTESFGPKIDLCNPSVTTDNIFAPLWSSSLDLGPSSSVRVRYDPAAPGEPLEIQWSSLADLDLVTPTLATTPRKWSGDMG